MKLYSADLSPYSARIRMQIYAKGIRDHFEFLIPPGFFEGRFTKTSPIGRIPALELDDGTIIPESEVISEYIEEMFPEPSMLGKDPVERANVRTLARIADIYIMNNIFMSLGQIRRETRNDAIVELLVGQLNRGVGALEEHISDGPFAAGETLSIADCALVPALWMCTNTVPTLDVPDVLDGRPKTRAWWERMQSHELAAKVIAEINAGLKRRLDGSERQPGAT